MQILAIPDAAASKRAHPPAAAVPQLAEASRRAQLIRACIEIVRVNRDIGIDEDRAGHADPRDSGCRGLQAGTANPVAPERGTSPAHTLPEFRQSCATHPPALR